MPGVKINDLYQLKSLSQPYPTDDGLTFFVQNMMCEKEDSYQADIYALDAKKNLRQFTNGGLNLQPVVSDNVLYYRHKDKEDDFQLMKMPVDGGVAEALKETDSVDQIILSPDKAFIFYKVTHTAETEQSDKAVRYLTEVQNKADGIGWLPTNKTYSLKAYDLATGKSKTFWTRKQDFNLQDVSSDNQKVLYLATEHPKWEDKFDDSMAVYCYDQKADKHQKVSQSMPEAVFSDAYFSPNGKKAALIGTDFKYYSASVHQLYFYDFAKDELKNVTGHAALNVGYSNSIGSDWIQNRSGRSGYWLSNDSYIFSAYDHGHSQLYRCNGQTSQLIHDKNRDIVDFAPIDDGQIVFINSTPEKAAELKVLNLGDQVENTLYNPNKDYEQSHQYAKVTSFHYPSTDQQVEVQGWFTEAQGNAETAPLILYVHGGPHAAYGDTFFHEFQALANEGYHVAYVNPRGSTSYGEDFARAVMGHYGECDYDDVMAGLDYVLDNFNDIDKKHLFIAGGSYGGFMSAWVVGHNNRFQAAVIQRPAIDWIGLYGNSDIGVTFVSAEMGVDLYTDAGAAQYYWEKSPLAYADKVQTPTRIQHGVLDRRCPTSQSEALFTAIKRTGTDCDYIRYPQSFHGLSRNGYPSLRVRRMNDIVDWFKRY